MALTITIPGAVEATIGATAPAILTVGVGVPGATGPAGATGATGATGSPGVGVPVGGTAGQFLTKIDGTNYNTDWTTINLSAYVVKANNLSDLANAATARTNLSLGSTNNVSFRSVNMSTGAANPSETYTYFNTTAVNNAPSLSWFNASYYDSGSGTFFTSNEAFTLNKAGINFVNNPTFDGSVPGAPTSGGSLDYVSGTGVLTLRYFENATTTDDTIIIEPTGVTFADATKQETAFIPADYLTAAAIATTYAPIASPALTGNPTAPTAALADNDTSIATTAFVQQELASGVAVAKNLEVYARNQTGSTIPIGSIVYINGATGNRPTITLAQANNDANSAQTIGFTKTAIANNGFGFVIIRGELENLNTSALTEGAQLYLSPTTAGTWTTTKPYAPQHLVYVGIVIRSHPTLGAILVSVQNGYELHELHDVALASEANNDLLTYESSTDLWKNKSFATLGLATLASPTFSGTPSLPTGTTGITQTAGNNTTALATTAFVVSNGGISTNVWAPNVSALSAATSGTGANTGSGVSTIRADLISPNTGVAGYATRGFTAGYPSNSASGAYNFSTASGHSLRVYSTVWASTITGVKMRGVVRTNLTLPAPATLAGRAYGWEWNWSTRTMNIIAFNTATGLTTTAVTWNPANGRTYEITCTSDGAGTISLYVDGTLLGTSSGGPTGSSANQLWWQYELQSEATSTAQVTTVYTNPKLYTTNG